jgi:plasmid stabilization system protein ParE
MAPRALEELEDAIAWYAAKSPQAVRKFAIAADAALDALETDPERFPALNDRYRYVRVQDFPYYFAYQIHGGHVAIADFRHTSQSDPEFDPPA